MIKLFLLACRSFYLRTALKVIHFLIWLLKKFPALNRFLSQVTKMIIKFKNRVKRLHHKLTTYNTDKIWNTCEHKCQSWPGTYKFGDGCKECEMWKKFSPKLKNQLDMECAAYAHHCITGE